MKLELPDDWKNGAICFIYDNKPFVFADVKKKQVHDIMYKLKNIF